jgi:prepilin-type N-terminal cleavage/methylation domain-containing protein
MKKTPKQFIKNQRGFTLVELMVSLMLFTIVVLAAVGSLYTVNNASRKVQAMRSVIDNLNFAVESMSRTIRTGNAVACGGESNLPDLGGNPNCPFDDQSPRDILYIDSTLGTDQEVEYRLETSLAGVSTGAIQKRTKEGGFWGNWFNITAPEINVQKLSFYVNGATVDDLVQPNVMIFVEGVATVNEETQPFAIQTYLSQRAVD